MPSALVLYHYLYPDDVVSSIHMSELCAGLAARGWDVTAMPCNRGCRDESQTYDSTIWRGVKLRRLWRPPLSQTSKFGRLINAFWMITGWSLLACSFRPKPDVVIIGTDPVLGVLAAIAWKRVCRTTVAHWCFDLYPEAAIAEGMLAADSLLAAIVRRMMMTAYRCCNLIVDLGECMRDCFLKYNVTARQSTILPWALTEPAEPLPVSQGERVALFGDARLALLYSGNFGRAHEWRTTIALARRLRDTGTRLVFSVRGNQEAKLRSQISAADINIGFAPFAKESQLEARLSSADIHIVSLRASWTGAVVPSKFFGALAAGRPVLFEGSEKCSIARCIRDYGVGWVLGPDNVQHVAADLLMLAESPERMTMLRRRCHSLYHQKFSRARGIREWDEQLRSMTYSSAETVASCVYSQPANGSQYFE